jgi:signal transduction histidine kinase
MGSVCLAAWQYHEYRHECQVAQDSLRRRADSVNHAILAGIRYQCGQGHFVDEDVQGLLDEVVKAEDVLAVSVMACEHPLSFAAIRSETVTFTISTAPGELWQTGGFLVVRQFILTPRTSHRVHKCLCGRPELHQQADSKSVFLAGGPFVANLLVDRTLADDRMHRAFWLRFAVTLVGSLLLFCAMLVWRATIRLAESRVALDLEARHLREVTLAAAGLAHETRTPLGLIQGWNQRIARSRLATFEQQEQANAVVEECNRLAYRINQFLNLAKPLEPVIVSVDLATVVDELAVLLHHDLQSKQLHLDRSGSASVDVIQADLEMVRQILFNLIRNAVQSSPDQGVIEVALRRGKGGCGRLEVADRGPGVPQEIVPSLFMPYVTTRIEGTGLGLAMVHRMAAVHGWDAGYSPRPGGGAIFWLDGLRHG